MTTPTTEETSRTSPTFFIRLSPKVFCTYARLSALTSSITTRPAEHIGHLQAERPLAKRTVGKGASGNRRAIHSWFQARPRLSIPTTLSNSKKHLPKLMRGRARITIGSPAFPLAPSRLVPFARVDTNLASPPQTKIEPQHYQSIFIKASEAYRTPSLLGVGNQHCISQ
jgi:hypothetical protein